MTLNPQNLFSGDDIRKVWKSCNWIKKKEKKDLNLQTVQPIDYFCFYCLITILFCSIGHTGLWAASSMNDQFLNLCHMWSAPNYKSDKWGNCIDFTILGHIPCSTLRCVPLLIHPMVFSILSHSKLKWSTAVLTFNRLCVSSVTDWIGLHAKNNLQSLWWNWTI